MLDNKTASEDYTSARAAFRSKVEAYRDARLVSYEHPERGPGGEPLFSDAAWLGRGDEKSVLVLVSGTHGVEGIAGSMIQRYWLSKRAPEKRPQGVAVLLVHALNPWGFAWHRRVTHENVDLNRNWIDFGVGELPANPLYGEIADIVAPALKTEIEPRTIRRRVLGYVLRKGLYGLALRRGAARFQNAVSGGQYAHPKGLFFGGSSPTWSQQTLLAIFRDFVADSNRIAIIDLHTGLGRNGAAEKMVSAPSGSERALRAERWFGGGTKAVGGRGSSSGTITGDWVGKAASLLPHAEVGGIALEFGTRPPLKVLEALIADNWLHAFGDPLGPDAFTIKRKIIDAFYDDSPRWRGLVTEAATQCCDAAFNALANLRSSGA